MLSFMRVAWRRGVKWVRSVTNGMLRIVTLSWEDPEVGIGSDLGTIPCGFRRTTKNHSLRGLSCAQSSPLEAPNFPKAILHLAEFVRARMFSNGLPRSLGLQNARGVKGNGVGADFLHFLKRLSESVWHLSGYRGMMPGARDVNRRWSRGCCCGSNVVGRCLGKRCRCRRRCYTCCHCCCTCAWFAFGFRIGRVNRRWEFFQTDECVVAGLGDGIWTLSLNGLWWDIQY